MWIAHVFVDGGREEMEMGCGWRGEWILEGEGTKEGKDKLVRWLEGAERYVGKGKGKRRAMDEGEGGEEECKWELVRERSGAGRVWLK